MEKLKELWQDRLFRGGGFGALFAALCCFTPILVWVFGGLGLAAYLVWADAVLFPLLFASLGVMAYAAWRRAGR